MAQDPMAPPGMHLCRFCGSIVPEAKYVKHKQESGRKGGMALKGTAAAYKKSKKAAKARWSRHRQRSSTWAAHHLKPSAGASRKFRSKSETLR